MKLLVMAVKCDADNEAGREANDECEADGEAVEAVGEARKVCAIDDE